MRRIRSVSLPRALSAPRRALSSAAREPASEAAIPTFSGNTKLFINNKFVNAVSGKTFPTFNPSNGTVLAQVAEADAADVDIAAKAARRAFDEGPWTQKMAPRERGACLYRLADLVEKHKAEFAQLETLNNGKALSLSQAVDVNATVAILRYYAGWADKINGKTVPIGPDFFNFTRHEPVGVVGAIIPWNLPLIGVAAKLGPALTTGNVIVLKSAEQTPLTAIRFAELVAEAGFPEGVVNILSGYGPTAGAAMATHPLIDKIAFTGSVEVGKRIQAAAAGTIKRVTLELGGKNPSIVFADADMDLAIDNVHNGLFWNKGEACAAGSRIFVEEKIYDEFVERATKKALAWRVGNPFDPKTDQGAQVSEEQFNKVMGYIASGKQEGAKLQAGGNRVGTKGYYVEPTVFSHVTDSMKVFREEIFGPVMTIAKFKSVDEVVKRANDSKYGLAAGVFTKDIVKGHMVASKLRAGLVFWNCYHVVDVSAPFGGMKESGFGREGGEYGLLPYLEVKNVVLRVTN